VLRPPTATQVAGAAINRFTQPEAAHSIGLSQ
jgi:hypothetical protein